MTISGIGYYIALLIKTEIGDMGRFISCDHLSSYAGLVPSTRLYWKIVYSSNCIFHGCYHGEYVVDAITGELMLVLEDHPRAGPLPPIKFSIEPSELVLKRGESAVVTVTVDGKPDYDVPIPISLEFEQVPKGLSVSIEAGSGVWTIDLKTTFTFSVSASADAPTGKTDLLVKIGAIGFGIGKDFDIEIK